MEILEMGLAHMDPPWEGYDDLIRNFLGQEVQGRTDRTQLSLAILEHRGDETIRRTKTHLSAIPGSAWTFKHTLSHDAVRVVVIASYREVRAGYWTKTINPRGQGSAFNRAVDFALDGKSVLDDGLLNPDVRGRKLEPWLTLLFAKMGYCTAPLGALAGDMPDLLAAADDLPLLVVECTEDSPDVNDKLGKLSMRAKKVAAAAGTETLPVLVTRLEASKVPESHRRKAADERIALVAQEQLVDFAEGSRDPPHAHAFLLSCIPARPNNSGVRNGITRFI